MMEGNDLWGYSIFVMGSIPFYYTTLEEVIYFLILKVFY